MSHLIEALLPDETDREVYYNNAEYKKYLNDLTSVADLEKLRHEPKRLQHEMKSIQKETQELAFENYRGFIRTAECSKDIFYQFLSVNDDIGNVLESLPSFKQECMEFEQSSKQIKIDTKLNLMSLSYHTQLLELLEIPQLMETCVKN
eukprot:Pgem_evm2s8882